MSERKSPANVSTPQHVSGANFEGREEPVKYVHLLWLEENLFEGNSHLRLQWRRFLTRSF